MIDITPVVVAIIVIVAIIWIIFRNESIQKPAVVMALAESAVRLAQDLRDNGVLPDGPACLDFAEKWIVERCEERGWKIDAVKCRNAARIAYQAIYGKYKMLYGE